MTPEGNFYRGLVIGTALSIPLWAVILTTARFLFW